MRIGIGTLGVCSLVLAFVAVSSSSQDAKPQKPSFPFEIYRKIEKPVSQIYVVLAEEQFNRETLVELFSYLGATTTLPVRVAVYTDRTTLELESEWTRTDSLLASSTSWDKRMRSLSILSKEPATSRRAYYYKDSLSERFNYDLLKDPVRFAVVTFRDSRSFENTPTFLFDAVKDGYSDAVRWFVRQNRKVNLDLRDSSNRSALSWALWLHHNEITKMLVEAGANVNQPSSSGAPLFTAIDARNREGARTLIEAGATVEQTDSKGVTPIIAAAVNCDYPMVKLLLENGAKVDVKDRYGKTAIDYSCNSKTIKSLLAMYMTK